MKDWLSALTNIQVDIGRSVVADKTPYGLDKPAAPALPAFLRPLAGQTNPFMADLLFGLGTNQAGRIFEMGNDEKYVNSIDPDAIRAACPMPTGSCATAPSGILNPTRSPRIDIHQLGGHLRYTRDEHNQWSLPRGSIVTIVQPAIEETLYQHGTVARHLLERLRGRSSGALWF